MSDSNGLGRRQLLTAGLAGIAGAAAGYAYGSRGSDAPIKPGPDVALRDGALPQYAWEIEIRGGYGCWFRTVNGVPALTLLTLAKDKCDCSDQGECVEHEMKLIAFDSIVKVDNTTTYQPTMEDGAMTWVLSGQTRFVKGMPGKGITESNRTPWNNIQDPYAPKPPSQGPRWDDQVWMPEREKARADATSYASAVFDLTDGYLEVVKTDNPQARAGRWIYKVNGNDKKKALTDTWQLGGLTDDLIGIETQTQSGTKQIYLRPARNGRKLRLEIRHKVILDQVDLNNGDKLHHFGRLYKFVGDAQCNAFVPPIYERWNEGTFTPGDLCPPLPLD